MTRGPKLASKTVKSEDDEDDDDDVYDKNSN